MRKINKFFYVAIALLAFTFTSCEKDDETPVYSVDFEDLTLNSSTKFWNGADTSGHFQSGEITFDNQFNTSWKSWSGYSYSQLNDVATAGYTNQYSVFDSTNGSNKFAILFGSTGSSFAKFNNNQEVDIQSISVCNSTYTALSMLNGDAYSKKFGGTSGNDQDWTKATFVGYNAVGDSIGAIDIFLADYRSSNNTLDYVLNKWTTVDLSSLGKVNKFTFRISSTDNGNWGMNTPAYVCIDNIKYSK